MYKFRHICTFYTSKGHCPHKKLSLAHENINAAQEHVTLLHILFIMNLNVDQTNVHMNVSVKKMRENVFLSFVNKQKSKLMDILDLNIYK